MYSVHCSIDTTPVTTGTSYHVTDIMNLQLIMTVGGSHISICPWVQLRTTPMELTLSKVEIGEWGKSDRG